MSAIFAILSHQDPEMLSLLVEKLDPHKIVVHVDLDQDLAHFRASLKPSQRRNVTFVEDRVSVNWGGYSVVDAMVACIGTSERIAEPRDTIVFLSGSCYPTRPVSEFIAKLDSNPGRVYCRAYPLASLADPWHLNRVRRKHWFDLRGKLESQVPKGIARATRVILAALPIRNKMRGELNFVAGSQWMAMPMACALDAVKALETPSYKIFRNSFAPDEMAIQTFVHNSKWSASVIEDDFSDAMVSKVSAIPNYHYLREDMSGFISLDEAMLSVKSNAFFIRKVKSSDVDVLYFLNKSISNQVDYTE